MVLSATSAFVMSAPTPLLTKASVTIFPCPTEGFVTYSFLVEDACVGGFMNSCLSLLDFMLKSLSSLPSFASPSSITAAIGFDLHLLWEGLSHVFG
jgi:hypothetical protein